MKMNFLSLLLAASLLGGCSASNNYVADRAGDFTDILNAKVMIGPGIGAYANVTEFLHLGYLYQDGVDAAGFNNRDAGTWTESVEASGLIVGHYTEDVSDTFEYGCYGWTYDPVGFECASEGLASNNPVDWAGLRVALMLGVGIDLELEVGELLDFVLGLTTIDIANDDR